jgi:hypothetical protein
MSTAAASGHAEGYQAGYADAVKAYEAAQPAAAQEAMAWSKTKPTTEGAYYVRGFAIGQDEALVQVRIHRFDGEPAPELVCNIHESTSNDDMDDWWPMVDLSDDFEWLGPLVAAPVAAAPVDLHSAARFAADVLAELYAKYQRNIGPFASQAQLANVRLGHALRASTPAEPVAQFPTKPIGSNACPMTGLPFYDNMEHPERGMIAMYGGPFDVYSIPELDTDGELRRERFDLDRDDWVEGGEPLGYFYNEQQPEAVSTPEAPVDSLSPLARIADAFGVTGTWDQIADAVIARSTPAAPGIDLREPMRNLYRAYVRLLESGMDRITSLGGDCDPVDVMEANDIDLRAAREALDASPKGDDLSMDELPGMWDKSDLIGGATDMDASPKGGSGAITDSMVDRACAAHDRMFNSVGNDTREDMRASMRAALTAAMQATSAEVGA